MKLGIIGCGNMGKAIAAGAINSKAVDESNLYIKNYSPETTQAAAEFLNAHACTSMAELIEKTDTIILGVKPQSLLIVLEEISQSGADTSNTLFISIVAGTKLSTIEQQLPAHSRIIRTMPNTPTMVGEGMIAYTLSASCKQGDEATLLRLLESSASLTQVPEHLMDAVTGLSGSGPAYVYTFIESLADGALKQGIPKAQALELAAKTVLGSAKMVIESELHPSVLRDQVTSPGGTTITGLAELEAQGFRNATLKAVEAATKRSKELGEK